MADIEKLLRKRQLTRKESLVILMVDFIKQKENTFNLPKHYENVTAEQLNKKYTNYFTSYYQNNDYLSSKRYEFEETLRYYNLYFFTNDLLSQAIDTSKSLQTSILYLSSILDILAILEMQKQLPKVKETSEITINRVADIHSEIVPYINYEIVKGYKFLMGYNSFIKALSDFTKVNELEQLIFSFKTLEQPAEQSEFFTVANIGHLKTSINALNSLDDLTETTKDILSKYNLDLSEFKQGNIDLEKYNYVYKRLEANEFLDEWRHAKELINELEK